MEMFFATLVVSPSECAVSNGNTERKMSSFEIALYLCVIDLVLGAIIPWNFPRKYLGKLQI
jgi:hypothetical protein